MQVQTVKANFSDYKWPNGTLLYPAMQPDSELLAADGLYNGKAYGPSVGWFKFAVLQGSSWDAATYTLDDASVAVQNNPSHTQTWPSSLSAFQERGGKIITYLGQQDQQITSFNSLCFYEHLAKGVGYRADQMDDFYRLFRIPGMGHCNGGPGAWVMGRGGGAAAGGIPFDREHNVLAAVVDWGEKGEAPDSIVGSKFVDDSPSEGITYWHRHCKYPSVSTFKGPGHE